MRRDSKEEFGMMNLELNPSYGVIVKRPNENLKGRSYIDNPVFKGKIVSEKLLYSPERKSQQKNYKFHYNILSTKDNSLPLDK